MKSSELSTFTLFRGLLPEDIRQISSCFRQKSYSSQSMIITAGDTEDDVYFIVKGTIKVVLDKADAKGVILAILCPGEIVGEIVSIQGGERFASVIALESTQLLCMASQDFKQCLLNYPILGLNLAIVLTRRLRITGALLLSYATDSVEERLTRLLYTFAQEHGYSRADGEVVIPLRLTQSDLAAMIGATRGRVNEVIQRLKESHLLIVDSQHQLRLTDIAALRKYFL